MNFFPIIVSCKDKQPVTRFFRFQELPPDRYRSVFEDELRALLQSWDGETPPEDRLKYLVGRYYFDFADDMEIKRPLTPSLVRYSSGGWVKSASGVRFTVDRHPIVSQSRFYTEAQRVKQSWQFDINSKTFTFFGEEAKEREVLA